MDLTRGQPEGYVPDAATVNFWSLQGLGHDSINQWVCTRARCERNGEPTSCAVCDGEGHLWPSPEAKQRYEAWEEAEPPTGEGWQLWETVSEGSPVSPVFGSEQEFAAWLRAEGYSAQAVKGFLERGWCLSMMMVVENGEARFYNNIESCGALGEEGER
jgi:hypothetical protein